MKATDGFWIFTLGDCACGGSSNLPGKGDRRKSRWKGCSGVVDHRTSKPIHRYVPLTPFSNAHIIRASSAVPGDRTTCAARRGKLAVLGVVHASPPLRITSTSQR